MSARAFFADIGVVALAIVTGTGIFAWRCMKPRPVVEREPAPKMYSQITLRNTWNEK